MDVEMIERACADCGRVFTPDRYNAWRPILYCGPSCGRIGRRRSRYGWRFNKFENDPEWAAQARARSAKCQRDLRARKKAAKAAAAEAAARREEAERMEADSVRKAAEAEAAAIRRTALLLFGLCADLSGSETPEEVARFSARMLAKGSRLGGLEALPAHQSTYAFPSQATAGP